MSPNDCYLCLRSVHYDHLPGKVLCDIYASPSHFHPHPQTRLYSMRQEAREQASTFPESMDQWDCTIDEFFKTLWKPVYIKLAGANWPVSQQWKKIVELHRQAYVANNLGV